ncbi:PaaX family transcriptional regulator [Litoreibacter sp.]|nr:PaaX family transcriptional regulator [Litoreibacter sp.]
MSTASFDQLSGHLRGDQSPRVWSLLVTVFGELAQQDGSKISGAVIGHLTRLIGIKPEATRVALHRLKKDGWIQAHRFGRNSHYALTPWGRAQSAQATPRIYATTQPVADAWLVLNDPAIPPATHDESVVTISTQIRISPTCPKGSQVFATQLTRSSDLPDWIADKLCDAATLSLSHAFSQQLSKLESALGASPRLTKLEIAALRVLIVHSWRKIVLKTPILPDFVFPAHWTGHTCRTQVATLLAQLAIQTIADLEEAVAA